MEWIEEVCGNPISIQKQEDGRIRKCGYISEIQKYLRVVLLEDHETIHNAFFDRDFNKSG
jgi:hypothetical protein